MLNKEIISTIVWDVEGVLYKTTPEMLRELENIFINDISERKNISVTQAAKLFHENLTRYKSKGLSYINLGLKKYIPRVKNKIDNLKVEERYIQEDKYLQELFLKLKDFSHIIFSNQPHRSISKVLELLGIPENTFDFILSSDNVDNPKPDTSGYKEILRRTKLPPNQHVYIGDRLDVDIVPAQVMGMNSILIIDKPIKGFFCLDSVYKIPSVLI